MTLEARPMDRPCSYCGHGIYWEESVSSKSGKLIPIDSNTGEPHRCQEYLDAKKQEQHDKLKKESDDWKHRTAENQAQYKVKRFLERRDKIRTEGSKSDDSAISVNENSGEDRPIIEYRPDDLKDW